MQLNQLKKPADLKRKRRIGRGGKKGSYSGKGMKGQKARAGANIRPALKEWIESIPKLRGYRHKPLKTYKIINLSLLQEKFNNGAIISKESLRQKGLISRRHKYVKILGEGKISKKFKIKGLLISKSALEKIEKAGGKILP